MPSPAPKTAAKPIPLPTPSTSHIPSSVYPPSEDSYLLLDTLSLPSETAFLTDRFPPQTPSPLLVELGTGSGVVLAFLLANARVLLGRADVLGLGVDVNLYACAAAIETARQAVEERLAEDAAKEGGGQEVLEAGDDGGRTRVGSGNGEGAKTQPRPSVLGAVQADLSSSLRAGGVDVLVFNPPYVPTETLPSIHLAPRKPASGQTDSVQASTGASEREHAFQEESHLLELAYAGGEDGMETTERFLEDVPRILSQRGVFYLLLCRGNNPEEVMRKIEGWEGGWIAERVGSSGKTAGWEKLVILRGWRDGHEVNRT